MKLNKDIHTTAIDNQTDKNSINRMEETSKQFYPEHTGLFCHFSKDDNFCDSLVPFLRVSYFRKWAYHIRKEICSFSLRLNL